MNKVVSVALDSQFHIHLKERPVRALVLDRVRDHRSRLLAAAEESNDKRLLLLGANLGSLAMFVHSGVNSSIQNLLLQIAAHCAGWVESNPGNLKAVFAAIDTERERQADLLRQKEILFDCSSPIVDPLRKFRVLLEEVGEVAAECDALERGKPRLVWPFLREELIQVAAVAVAWLESLEETR
jgi:hypothetical protein